MKKRIVFVLLVVVAILLVSCATGANSYYIEEGVIEVKRISVEKPNYFDGIDMNIAWRNLSGKEIKYIYFDVQAFNAVDDPVKCDIRRESVRTVYVPGPIPANFNNTHYWDAIWYNRTIKRAEILNIRIEYMDGTTKEIALRPAVY